MCDVEAGGRLYHPPSFPDRSTAVAARKDDDDGDVVVVAGQTAALAVAVAVPPHTQQQRRCWRPVAMRWCPQRSTPYGGGDGGVMATVEYYCAATAAYRPNDDW